MDALISGTRGLAVLDDGKQLFALRPGEDLARRISPTAMRVLLDDCRDLEQITVETATEAGARLEQAVNEQEALQALLFLLDDEFSSKLRTTLALALEEYLEDQHLQTFLESTLYARPLPSDGDLPGALRIANAASCQRVSTFLKQLEELQPTIAAVAAAWDRGPAEILGQRSVEWNPTLVRQGLFRQLVLQLSAGNDLQPVLDDARFNPHFYPLRHSASVLQEWGTELGLSPKYSAYPRREKVSYVAENAATYDAEAKETVEPRLADQVRSLGKTIAALQKQVNRLEGELAQSPTQKRSS